MIDILDEVLVAFMDGDHEEICGVCERASDEELCSLVAGLLMLTQTIMGYGQIKRGIPLDKMTQGTMTIAVDMTGERH